MIENRVFPKFPLPDFKVAVRCITYNHAPYITDALKGFVMQKTDFPFITIVIDDSSTDGEQGVIEKYMKEEFSLTANSECESWETSLSKMIYARHPLNKECYFVVLLLKRNLYNRGKVKCSLYFPWIELCKYWAECEGDDYWIDPLKLQKQVDVMEKHPECSICFGKVKCVNSEKEPLDKTFPSRTIPAIFSQDDFMRWEFLEGSWVFQTSCFLFRTDILTEYSDALQTRFKNFPHGDLIIQLYCLEKGNGCYISNHVSCYRVDSGGYNSYLETHKSVAIKTYERKILGLKEYNKATNYKFHHELNIAILGIEWGNERLKNCKHGFFSSKYIPLYKEKGIKETLIMLMSYYTPTLLKYLVNLKKKINGEN